MRMFLRRWQAWWISGVPAIALAAFIGVTIFLALRRHATFHTFLFDLGYYTQVIWNMAHGNWFATSLKAESYLGNHFLLATAVFTPFFWIAADTRTLLILEGFLFAPAILPGYFLLRVKYPLLAPLLVIAFVINPLTHQIASEDLQGLMLSVPPMALVFYAVYTQRLRLLALAVALTLLVREDMGIYIASLGVYILIFRPLPRRYGLALILIGAAWLLSLTMFVMPRLGNGTYPHVFLFDLGGSIPEIVWNILRDPVKFAQLILAPEKLAAFARVMSSLGGLPLIGAGEQLWWLPGIILFFASSDSAVNTLQHWWIAPLVPLFWGSLALTLRRLDARWASLGAVVVVLASLVSFRAWSPFPFGGQFDAERYHASPHDDALRAALTELPPQARIAVTNRMGPHVAQRSQIFLFPWYRPLDVDYVVVDERDPDPYPLSPEEMRAAIAKLQADTQNQTVFERDGVYLFRLRAPMPLAKPGNWRFEPYLQMDGVEAAQTDAAGAFQSLGSAPAGGRTLRVILDWTVLAKMPANYSISVQLQTGDGALIAQDDAWLARGTIATETLKPGQRLRDTHYLELPAEPLPAKSKLVVLVYETATGNRLAPADGFVVSEW